MATTITTLTENFAASLPQKKGDPPNLGTVKSGRALAFDGVVDYLDAGTNAELAFGSGNHTLVAWFNIDAHSSGYHYIVSIGDNNTGKQSGLGVRNAGGVLFLSAYSSPIVETAATVTAGDWHRLVMVYTGNSTDTADFYVDGAFVEQEAINLDVTVGKLMIGSNVGASPSFDGKISDVQVWDTAWTLSDVTNDYTHPEMLAHTFSGTSLASTNLKVWYPMTEGNPESPQTTIFDGSGNQNHATSVFYGDEEVVNGDMETFPTLHATNDDTFTDESVDGSQNVTMVTEGTIKNNGSKSAKCTLASGETTGYVTYNKTDYTAGKTYRAEVYMRAGGSQTISAFQVFADDSIRGEDGTDGAAITPDEDFAIAYVEFVATATTMMINMKFTGTATHYAFIDDFSIKEIGLSTTGHVEGQETIFQPAFVGQNRMIAFDGVDDKVDLGDSKPNDGTGNISISAWINPNSFGEGTKGRIIDNGNLYFYVNDTNDKLTLSRDNSTELHSANDSISTGSWQHIAITSESDGTNTNFYINGSLSGTANQDATTPVAKSTNTIIGNNNAGGRTFDGFITDLTIWTSVLTLAQIQEIYNDGVPLDLTSNTLTGSPTLIGHWRNNELHTDGLWKDLTESDGSGDNGTLTGGSTVIFPEGTTSGRDINGFFLTHPNKNYLSCDDSDSNYVEIPHSDALNFGTGDFTIECWAKAIDWDYNTSSDTFLVCKTKGDGQNYWYLRTEDDGYVQFYSKVGNVAKNACTDNTSLTNNTWYHICFVANRSGNGIIYLNGASADTTDISGDASADYSFTGSLYIGRYDATSTFNGQIDDVRIYNKALSASEVTKNYRHGSGKHKD